MMRTEEPKAASRSSADRVAARAAEGQLVRIEIACSWRGQNAATAIASPKKDTLPEGRRLHTLDCMTARRE
jgi:hypothetical protein